MLRMIQILMLAVTMVVGSLSAQALSPNSGVGGTQLQTSNGAPYANYEQMWACSTLEALKGLASLYTNARLFHAAVWNKTARYVIQPNSACGFMLVPVPLTPQHKRTTREKTFDSRCITIQFQENYYLFDRMNPRESGQDLSRVYFFPTGVAQANKDSRFCNGS